MGDQYRRKIIVLTLFFAAAGCVSASGAELDLTDAKKNAPEYDKIFPYYVEVCAVSRIRPVNATEGGGWGHALMYLKGVCLDSDFEYPRLRLCRDGEVDLESSEAGAGISVDKMFKTVNWMAVPGKRFFFHGNHAEGERLTDKSFEATIQEALKQKLFRGIALHQEYARGKSAVEKDDEFVARKTAGTDYAIKFGRTSLCARLPVTKEMTGQMVDYLNQRNDEVFSGKTVFKWSAYYDNCAHTVHNALAAAGIWKAKSINQFRIKQFFNRAIPTNEFADFAFLGQKYPGALLKIIPAHEPNDLFGTDYELFVLEGPVRKPITRKVRKMFSDPRHTDLEANLLYFRNRNEGLLKKDSGSLWRILRSKRSELVYNADRRSTEEELKDLNQKLQRLSEIQ